MGAPTHNIQKQVLEFKFSNTAAAKEWQQNVAFAEQDRYVKMIETVLDRYDDGKNHLVDRLTIDLGNIKAVGETSQFENLFEEALSDYFSQGKGSKKNTDQKSKFPTENANGNSLIQGFVHFLEQGTLTWQDLFKSILELELRLKKELSPSILLESSALRSSLQKRLVRQRLYYQFSPSFSAEILKTHFKPEVELFQAMDKFIVLVLTDLNKKFALEPLKAEAPKIIKAKIKEAGILKWISLDAPNNIQDWPNIFLIWNLNKFIGIKILEAYEIKFLGLDLKQFSQQTQGNLKSLLEEILMPKDSIPQGQKGKDKYDDCPIPEKSNKKKQANGQESQENAQKLSQTDKPEKIKFENFPEDQESGSDAFPKKDSPFGSPSLSPLKRGAIPVSVRDEFKGDKSVSLNKTFEALGGMNDFDDLVQPDDAYYTNHSGIILTWPYLSKLFAKLKLTQDFRFKDKTHQQMAVCLLGYIATGETIHDEPDLIIAKFLCGWPIQMPIKKKIRLKKRDMTEADTMLLGLIANWPILKKTSITGLRETFFQREGKLFKEDGQWRLIVEQKTTDILLDHLPYTLAIIKLPWLKELLKVDWA